MHCNVVGIHCDLFVCHLQAQVGNAVTDDRHIVIGMGSSQIINAALFAVSNASRSPEGEHKPQISTETSLADWICCSLNTCVLPNVSSNVPETPMHVSGMSVNVSHIHSW